MVPSRESTHAVVIVGGGIAGVATAYFLAQRGVRDVVVVEKEPSLGEHSTGRNAGILRTWSGDAPTRILADESVRFLRRPPADFTDVPLVDPVGLILITDPARSFDEASWARLRAERADLEELDAGRFRELAPWFEAPEGPAWLVGDEGKLDGAALLDGFARGARAAGTEFLHGHAVAGLLAADGVVVGVRLDDGSEVRAERVVVAAGGWAERLGREVGSPVRLRPTRRHLLVTAPDSGIDPGWPVVWTDTDPFYARPESGGFLMSACDQTDVTPDSCVMDPDVAELVARKAARYMPAHADAGVAHFWAGMRTLTHDGRFVIGPDPAVGGLFWVAGLGGHGMTCGVAVGRLAAGLLHDAAHEHPAAAAVSPSRFVRGAVGATE